MSLLTASGALFASHPLPGPIDRADWQPRIGDQVMVDTDSSTVYLVHADGSWLTIDGLTGQRRSVSYIGRRYYAGTPDRSWEVREVEQKGKSVTFGDGRFLRLFVGHANSADGPDGRTAYGIHSHASFARMLQDKAERNAWDPTGTGHRSMGCILVSEEDLSLIIETWSINEGVLQVATGQGLTPWLGTAVASR